MRRIKVLHVIGGGEFGGAEQHLLTLARNLDCSRFELHIACLFAEPLASRAAKEGFPVHVFPMKSKLDLQPVSETASLIRREGFEIVHTHGVRANLVGRLAAGQAGIGHVVTTVHSVLSYDYPGRLARWVNGFCEKATRRRTGHFIAVCEMLARRLKSEGVPDHKIVTIHNGLEIADYDPGIPGDPVRQEFGISPDAVVMGIIARLHPVKGHRYLLEAMAAVIPKLPHLTLLVVGTGPDREKLEEQVAKLGLGDRVIFTGFRRDIPGILAALDFSVLPSLSEGLSLTVMEAMAMKKPVLATRTGGTPEIITSGVDGLLVPPADVAALTAAIEQLAGAPKALAEMGAAARKTIEARFTAGMMAEKTADLYRQLLM